MQATDKPKFALQNLGLNVDGRNRNRDVEAVFVPNFCKNVRISQVIHQLFERAFVKEREHLLKANVLELNELTTVAVHTGCKNRASVAVWYYLTDRTG